MACNELIDVTGRAAIQAVLQLSATQAAGGPQQQGKRRAGDVVFYGPSTGPSVSERPQAGSGAAALGAAKGQGTTRSKFPLMPPCRTDAHGGGMLDVLPMAFPRATTRL